MLYMFASCLIALLFTICMSCSLKVSNYIARSRQPMGLTCCLTQMAGMADMYFCRAIVRILFLSSLAFCKLSKKGTPRTLGFTTSIIIPLTNTLPISKQCNPISCLDPLKGRTLLIFLFKLTRKTIIKTV